MANFGLCSKWYIRDNVKEFKELISVLKKGDAVQVKNLEIRCSTWAICITEGPKPTVAYRYSDLSFKKKDRKIPQELVGLATFDDVRKIRINNSRDKLFEPKSVEEIFKDLEIAAHRFNRSGNCFKPSIETRRWEGSRDFVVIVRYSSGQMKNRLDIDGYSLWFAEDDVETFLWLLQEKDLVELNKKGVYSHWAVCREKPQQESHWMMAHRCGSETGSELKKDLSGAVTYSSLEVLARGCRFRINNSWQHKYETVSGFPKHPFYSPCYTIGPYDPRSNNSWHYVMRLLCRINKRGNLALKTQWYSSAEELWPLLAVGDVIKYRRKDDEGRQFQEWAIYIGCTGSGHHVPEVECKDERQVPEVYYRCLSKLPTGVAIVRTATLEEFSKNSELCIDNRFDDCCQSRKAEDIVQEGFRDKDQEDRCPCDRFRRVCPHFAYVVRYGNETRTILQEVFSCWWAKENLEEVQSEVLHLGDIVETKERLVSHFVVYVGNGQVIHRCRNSDSPISTLSDFVEERQFRINNFWDLKFKTMKVEDVVQQSMDAIGVIRNFRIYNLTGNDCFDFVCQTRYNLMLSQVELSENNS